MRVSEDACVRVREDVWVKEEVCVRVSEGVCVRVSCFLGGRGACPCRNRADPRTLRPDHPEDFGFKNRSPRPGVLPSGGAGGHRSALGRGAGGARPLGRGEEGREQNLV